MAKKGESSSKTTVHRIKASDDRSKKAKKVEKPTKQPTKTKSAKPSSGSEAKASFPELAIGYFKGAWQELKLVRWPTRSATWAMTAAVLIFTFIFVVIILLLDAGFNWMFEQILK